MSEKDLKSEAAQWTCAKCSLPLEMGKVNVGYLGHYFTVNLPRCSQCGQVLITAELAMGQMVEAEKFLEDK
jgi:hypothetical protein